MPYRICLFILFFSPLLQAQDAWLMQALEVLPGQPYYSGSTVPELAKEKKLGKNITLTFVGERPGLLGVSRLMAKLPGKKRGGFLYGYESQSFLRTVKRQVGQWYQVTHKGQVYQLNFVDTVAQARNLETFNVNRALLPINISPSVLEWGKIIDPDKGVKSWLEGEIKTTHWSRALADPFSWALKWAELTVEQGRGGKLSLNLPGPAMNHVIERFASENIELSSEQKENIRATFAHPQANEIFRLLQETGFFEKLIPHSGVRKIMYELKINPWAKTRAVGRSCRQLFAF